jgi:hypothetical protein
MSTIIKAIETQYKGYRFRSRLEARWAVFFDTLGIAWEYEKEGYDLGDAGWYLPDFWLPQVNMWAEVKAEQFTSLETMKAWRLCQVTQNRCLLLLGLPQNKAYTAVCSSGNPYELTYCLTMYHGYPINEHRFYCNPGCDCSSFDGTGCDMCQFEDTENAIAAARSARFEHGESGRPQ